MDGGMGPVNWLFCKFLFKFRVILCLFLQEGSQKMVHQFMEFTSSDL